MQAIGRMALCWAAALLASWTAAAADSLEAERAAMVRAIESYRARLPEPLAREGFDARVLEAMRAVPRHEFVPERLARRAYEDRPLPIGQGQTISQPLIVALMTSLLRPAPDHVVLEVGTGSGYQAAVLSALVRRVHTIEIVPELAASARDRLKALGYDDVEVRAGDGYHGWAEAAPFDGIMVTAGADRVPPRLLRQLRPGGRLVMPLGDPWGMQHLTVVELDAEGRVHTERLLPVRFVPLTRERTAAPEGTDRAP